MDRSNFDIVGICETRRKGEGCLILNKSGHQFYYKGGNTHQNGIGFIVNKNIAGNVTSFKGFSDRVAQLTIKINSKYHLSIIQAYLPTSSHTNEEVDTVYEEIDNLVNNTKPTTTSLWVTSTPKLDRTTRQNSALVPTDRAHATPEVIP